MSARRITCAKTGQARMLATIDLVDAAPATCEASRMADQGVVTIMHADVEGSTELTTRLGDEVGRTTLEATKRIVRERAETFGGRQIDAVGDAMMFTFTSTRQAIAGAMAVQRTLAEGELERPEETLRVRIGLNVGEVLERDGHPFGAAVNAGARVMAKASGGQIFASEMVVRLAGTMPGVTFRDRGRHVFKGFDERWRLYEVDWARPAPPPKPAKRPRKVAARPSRRAWVILPAVAAIGAAVLVAALVMRGDDNTPVAVPPNSVAMVDPGTDRVIGAVEGVLRPGPVAAGAGSIWVGSLEDETLVRIDPTTEQVIERIQLPATPDGIAVGEGAVWVVHGRLGTLTRVNPRFNTVVDTISLAGRAIRYASGGVAVGPGAIWAAYGDSTLARLDPATNVKTGSTFVGVGPTSVVAAFGSVWVSSSGDSKVERFSPVTFEEGPVDELTVGGSPTGLASGAGAIWVASPDSDYVTRIDPSLTTTSPLPIPVADGPAAVAAGADAVWVANTRGGTLSRIDPATSAVVETIPVGNAPSGIAVGSGLVWVAVQAP